MIYLSVAIAASFNLVCSGTIEKTTYEGKTSTPYNSVYRVDLDGGRWCVGNDQECKTPETIKVTTEKYIKFIYTWPTAPGDNFRYVDQVDRETGEHQLLIQSGSGAAIVSESGRGVCQKAPFSGFTTFKRKF